MTTYAEALAQAKAISPNAKVRIIKETQEWEIFIPTNLGLSDELSETYQGTPAWRAYEDKDTSYGNKLALWGFRRNMFNTPIDFIADQYNLEKYDGAEMSIYLNDLNKATGINVDNWDNFSNEDFSQYKRNVDIASKKVNPAAKQALAEKWKDLG